MTLLLLSVVAAVAAVSADQPWDAPRWGMTVSEVRAVVRQAQPGTKEDEDMSTNPLTKVRLRSATSLFGRQFAVYYEFSSDRQFDVERLARISLREAPYDARATDALIQGLSSRYGAAVGDEGSDETRFVQWEHEGNTVVLSEMRLHSGVKNAPLLYVVIQPSASR